MKRIECAVSRFKEGFSCSQALLSTYGTQFGLNRKIALKVSGAFGGGLGCMGETCGAVIGAFMVIGLKYGKANIEDSAAEEKTYSIVNEFVRRFKLRNGSIICRELLCCDISTSAGMTFAEEMELFTTICPRLVRDAAEIIEEIL